MGCVLMVWDGVSLPSPPLEWTLNSPDVVEPKVLYAFTLNLFLFPLNIIHLL